MLSRIFKFYIYRSDPELAHKLAIKFIKTPFIKLNLLPNDSYENLYQNVLDMNFKSPIGLAAGFDKNAEIYNQIFDLGFGFTEVGTITPYPQEGNPKPRVFRLVEDKAIINRLGFPNDGMSIISKRIKNNPAKGICGINIGPNKENATSIEDYLSCFDQFFNYASYITINISSPNTPNLRSQHDDDKISQLIDSIQWKRSENKSKIPILLKISPDIDDNKIKNLCNIFIKKKINGIILTNTTIKNRDNLFNKNKFEKGGLSGAPLKDLSNDVIKKFYSFLGESIPIIGAGGVSCGETAFEKIKSGATLLQLYTSLVYEGPYVAKKIICLILTFVPIKFVHPLRVKELRNLTIFFTIIWSATTLKLVTTPSSKIFMIDSTIIFILWALTSIYFAVICWGRSVKKPEN